MKSFRQFIIEKPTTETKRGGSGTNSGGGDPWWDDFDPEVEKQILDAQNEEDPLDKSKKKFKKKILRDNEIEKIKKGDQGVKAADRSYRGAKVKGEPRRLGAFRSNTTVNKRSLSTVPLGSTDASDPQISDRLDKVRKQRVNPKTGRATKSGIKDFLTKSKTKNLTVDSKKGQKALKDIDAIMKKGSGSEYQHAKKSIEGTRVKGREGVKRVIKGIKGATSGRSELGNVKGYYAPSDYSGKRAKVATTKQIKGYTDALKKSGALTKKGGKLITQKRPDVIKLETSTRKGYIHKPKDLSKVTSQTTGGNTVTGNYGGSLDDVYKQTQSTKTPKVTTSTGGQKWQGPNPAPKQKITFKNFLNKTNRGAAFSKIKSGTRGVTGKLGAVGAAVDAGFTWKGERAKGRSRLGATLATAAKVGSSILGGAAGAFAGGGVASVATGLAGAAVARTATNQFIDKVFKPKNAPTKTGPGKGGSGTIPGGTPKKRKPITLDVGLNRSGKSSPGPGSVGKIPKQKLVKP